MRLEQDEVGVSLFIEPSFHWGRMLGGLTLPGLTLLVFGLVATLVGLEWAGPALLFVGIGLCISIPLTLEDPPTDLCTYLRFDHLGVRANGRRLSAEARIEELDRGLRLHDAGSVYLPVTDPVERRELVGLLERSLRCGDGGCELPTALLDLKARARVARGRTPGDARRIGS